MFVVIVTAGIDLSVGSIMALAMVCLAIADKRLGLPWPVVILIGPLIGIACGCGQRHRPHLARDCRIPSS